MNIFGPVGTFPSSAASPIQTNHPVNFTFVAGPASPGPGTSVIVGSPTSGGTGNGGSGL